MVFYFFPWPIRIFSGFKSLWMKFFEWKYSRRWTIYIAIRRMVLSEKLLLQNSKSCCRFGPKIGIISTIKSPSTPNQCTQGIPSKVAKQRDRG